MEVRRDRPAEVVAATLDRELQLVREAIAMVALGGSRRVIVAGIHFGDVLLEPGRQLAHEAGVRLTPLWRADEAGVDVAVERIGQ